MKYTIKHTSMIMFLILSACVPEIENEIVEGVDSETSAINIPEGFDYSTYRTVNVKINDDADYVKYDVYAYSEALYSVGYETYETETGETEEEEVFRNDVMNKLVFSGIPKKGVLEQYINIPAFYDKLYIRRNENLNYSASIETIYNNEVEYFHTKTNNKSSKSSAVSMSSDVVNDYLYCVNGSGELFQIDPLNGALTYLSDMPMGSWTCAIDQENKVLYSIGKSNPYPLMKYSIETNTWSTIANMGQTGPRLAYNSRDNLLYFSNNKGKLYTINPLTGEYVNDWQILGLHNPTGGDIDFADDGTIYVCTFSGLYKIELNEDNDYISYRISADNLPFQPTSMTIDSNQELWLAQNGSNSDLIIMDTQTGGWKYKYGNNAGNNTNFGRTINDLTTFRVITENVEDPDSDGDGVVDRDDEYPEDPDKAFEIFTPSKYGTGTIAFEDLWPSNGDYDFNDMALNYQAIAVLNSNNLVVQVDFICRVKSNIAGYTNAVGIEIEGITSNQIESVEGAIYSENYINLNANGTEANQDKAVVILTDNADNLVNEETTISIILNNPITTEELGTAPFNPFIIANKVRENEIHLPYGNTTSLGQKLIEITGQNHDPDGNYISDNGYPWAISIIHDFKVPKESVRIYDAYNNFNNWATSGGQEFKDWYKDNPGYRNEDKLQN